MTFGAFAVAACTVHVNRPGPNAGGGTVRAERACDRDADCEVVQTACCDHCNGGKADAFAKGYAAAHRAKNCEGTACTMRACGPAVAVCNAGQCAARIEPLLR